MEIDGNDISFHNFLCVAHMATVGMKGLNLHTKNELFLPGEKLESKIEFSEGFLSKVI